MTHSREAYATGHLGKGGLDWRRPTSFICDVCGLPGVGSPHAKRHAGECKREGQRRFNARRKMQ